MRKLSVIAAGLLGLVAVGAEAAQPSDWQSKFSLDVKNKFVSENVRRGRREGQKGFKSKVNFGYEIFDSVKVGLGVDSSLTLRNDKGDIVAPYFDISYDASEMFTLEAGYLHNFHSKLDPRNGNTPLGVRRNTNEIFCGVNADVLLSPSLFIFYDFDRRETAIEGKVGYNFDLSQYAISGLGVDFGAKLGFDSSKKPYGKKHVAADGKKGYCYYGANADLTYAINSNAKAKIGVAYDGSSAKKTSWTGNLSGHKHKNFVWFNASIDCSF
ncbi:MAG: hypothetical protein LBT64_01530 [Puniceicoccales bacterium]|jgi:hypothetical protein|nr:hypothetical protein [Puniceicoccales bacterium]